MIRATAIIFSECEIASSPLPSAEMSSVNRIVGRRPMRSESAPRTGARTVCDVQSVDCSSPYAIAFEPISFTRKGSTGTSTVFDVCARKMMAKGPQRSERTSMQLLGTGHDFASPSGR